MKIKSLLTMVVSGLVVIVGCGQNVAPSTATITASPTSITLKDNVDPYVDEFIYTIVSIPGAGSTASAIPMNGVKVTYNAGFALGQQANSTGIFAFINKDGTICQSPCVDTTDSRGISTMRVRLCTTLACQQAAQIPLPSTLTAGQPVTASISYTTNINVSSGSAAPAVVTVSVN